MVKRTEKIFSLALGVLLVLSMVYVAHSAAVFVGGKNVETGDAAQAKDQVCVVIDAGHGGDDPGKIGIGQVLEKDVNLSIARKVQQYLEAQDIRVVLTREDENGLYDSDASNKKVQDMKRRVALIEETKPAITVSIHQNSYPEESVHGAQVFYYDGSRDGQLLAQLLQKQLVEKLDPENHRQIKANDSYYLLKKTDIPIVIVECGFLSNQAEAALLARTFWPGPLTMILPKAESVPYETTGGLETVAVRMPSHPVARRLIVWGGGYVAAPSANLSGRPSPTSAKYVLEDMNGRIDMILDGGEGDIGLESTIVDLTVSPPQILRPGYITREMLETVLGQVGVDQTILQADSGQAPRAPGMKYRHYAPKGELTIISGPAGQVTNYINIHAAEDRKQGYKVGVIGTDEALAQYRADVVSSLGSRRDEDSIARHLYSILREFDDAQVTRIYSECFETTGLGQAIMNRLLKAAGHKLIVLDGTVSSAGQDNRV